MKSSNGVIKWGCIFIVVAICGFMATFSFADTLEELVNLPGLNTPQQNVARGVFNICTTFPEPINDAQSDFRDRCSEVVVSGQDSEKVDALYSMDSIETDSMGTATIEISTTQFFHVLGRLSALRKGAGGSIAMNIDGQKMEPLLLANLEYYSDAGTGFNAGEQVGIKKKWGAFFNSSFVNGEVDPSRLEPGFDFDTKGITAGIDYKITDNFIIGIALGYGLTDADLDQSTGDLEVDGYDGSLYGTYYFNNFYIDFIGLFGTREYDLTRNVLYSITALDGGVTDVNQIFIGETDSHEFSTSVGLGYDIRIGGFNMGPYARLNYLDAEIDGYEESLATPNSDPGFGVGIRIEDQDLESLVSILGFQINYASNTDWGVLTPYCRFEWAHEYENDAREIHASFINDHNGEGNKEVIYIPTDDPDKDYFNLGLGIAAIFPRGIIAFVDYQTVLRLENVTSHLFSAGIRLEF